MMEVPSDSSADDSEFDPLLQWRAEIDAQIDAFERAWKRNLEPQLDDFLLSLPPAQLGILLRELVEIDLVYRRNRGEAPVPRLYTDRYPEFATMLRELVWKERGAAVPCVLPEPGTQLAEFIVDEPIGQGAMGVIYRATRQSDGLAVALKVSRFDRDSSWKLAERFRREANLLARLRHPNIVQYVRHDVAQTWQFLAIELLPGPTLMRLVAEQKALPFKLAVKYTRELLMALHHLEEQRIVHRDIHSSNLMLAADGTLKLIDFGLARPLVGEMNLTSINQMLGAPGFMSPEAAAGLRSEVGFQSDTFSAASVLYHLLTGRVPFATGFTRATEGTGSGLVAPRQIRSSIPRDLETLVQRALSLNPLERMTSARDLLEELARFQQGKQVMVHDYGFWDNVQRKLRHWIA